MKTKITDSGVGVGKEDAAEIQTTGIQMPGGNKDGLIRVQGTSMGSGEWMTIRELGGVWKDSSGDRTDGHRISGELRMVLGHAIMKVVDSGRHKVENLQSVEEIVTSGGNRVSSLEEIFNCDNTSDSEFQGFS